MKHNTPNKPILAILCTLVCLGLTGCVATTEPDGTRTYTPDGATIAAVGGLLLDAYGQRHHVTPILSEK